MFSKRVVTLKAASPTAQKEYLGVLSFRRGWELPQGEFGIDIAKNMIDNVNYFRVVRLPHFIFISRGCCHV